MKYVPEWFPGAKFKKMARRFRELEPYFVDETFLAVKEETVSYDQVVFVQILTRCLLPEKW